MDTKQVTLEELDTSNGVETETPSRFAIYSELTKARLTVLVLLTTLAGFLLASNENVNYVHLLHTLFGTGLLAAGASALNQWMERKWDALMKRTCQRPLPAKHIRPGEALAFGVVSSVIGTFYLLAAVNVLSAVIGLATLLSYILLYTPLKRYTAFNTLLGAIPGALPPVIGWVAAKGTWDTGAWILFGVLFFWQIPHFLSISWIYREDYVNAGFRMLSNDDNTGETTARHAIFYCIALVAVSLLPLFTGMTNLIYFSGAFILGATFLAFCFRFMNERTYPRARALFLASVLYLPCLLALMTLDQA
ncbi:MAG: heme o synthase [Verrucomicrobiota bacterium]